MTFFQQRKTCWTSCCQGIHMSYDYIIHDRVIPSDIGQKLQTLINLFEMRQPCLKRTGGLTIGKFGGYIDTF